MSIQTLCRKGPGLRAPRGLEADMDGDGKDKTHRLIPKQAVAPTGIPQIDAHTLLGTGREVILIHKDMQYRLRLTSNDKLILTK